MITKNKYSRIIDKLNKRITYLKGGEIINLSDYVKDNKLKASSIFNAARRQSIPAFRERGVWKIHRSRGEGSLSVNSNVLTAKFYCYKIELKKKKGGFMSQGKMGRWAFIIGLIIAVLLGFVSFTYASLILVILGIIVGFLNVSEKEATSYLIAVIALMVVGIAGLQALSVLGSLYTWIQTVLTSFIIFVAASAVIVAIKELLDMGKSE